MGTVNLGPQPTAIELSRALQRAGFSGWGDAALAAWNRQCVMQNLLREWGEWAETGNAPEDLIEQTAAVLSAFDRQGIALEREDQP